MSKGINSGSSYLTIQNKKKGGEKFVPYNGLVEIIGIEPITHGQFLH